MTEPTAAPKKTKTEWGKHAVHKDVTLPSGMVVDIKLPNLALMVKSGQIPNPLVDAALEFGGNREPSRDALETSWDFLAWIVPQTVVAPEITQEDIEKGLVPSEDLDMLAGFIARATDLDAVGNHLGGLQTNATFRRFRNLLTTEEIAEDLR